MLGWLLNLGFAGSVSPAEALPHFPTELVTTDAVTAALAATDGLVATLEAKDEVTTTLEATDKITN